MDIKPEIIQFCRNYVDIEDDICL